MSSQMSCTFNQYTNTLYVTSPVASQTSGSAISFSVDNFLNPYNGKIWSGYVVQTTDGNGGNIDSSKVGNIPLSIQMTLWASFI